MTIEKVLECCKKRKDILEQNKSIKEYNKYYNKMRKYARSLIDENKQDDLLPYLNDKNVSIRFDIAILLYNSYPDLCEKVLNEISNMNVQTGLPEHFVIISIAAYDNLKYGIPKDFP